MFYPTGFDYSNIECNEKKSYNCDMENQNISEMYTKQYNLNINDINDYIYFCLFLKNHFDEV
jgi:hypothetical protein